MDLGSEKIRAKEESPHLRASDRTIGRRVDREEGRKNEIRTEKAQFLGSYYLMSLLPPEVFGRNSQ